MGWTTHGGLQSIRVMVSGKESGKIRSDASDDAKLASWIYEYFLVYTSALQATTRTAWSERALACPGGIFLVFMGLIVGVSWKISHIGTSQSFNDIVMFALMMRLALLVRTPIVI